MEKPFLLLFLLNVFEVKLLNETFFFFTFFPLGQHDSYSSYDSLDKYNYALETLKLSDSANHFSGNVNNCMLQPKCRQPYVHNERKMDSDMVNDELNTPKLPPRPPLPKTSQSSTTIDQDLAKQQQLSDWYYIKTGPKSPLPTPRSEKRNDIYNSPSQTTVNRTTASIPSNNNDTSEGIYVSRETSKNRFNVHSQNMIKRVESDNSHLDENVQMAKTDDNKNDKDTLATVYKTINVPSSCDDIRKLHIPPNHHYSAGEPLCKFNYRNNSEKVNGCLKRQQPQEIQHRIPLISPPSPSITPRNVHQQQTHPFYYVEPSQKHFSSPRQDKHRKQSVDFQQKSHEPQCEQIQAASNLKSHNERLNSAAAAATAMIMTSNSNSNIHKLAGVHLQQTDHCGNANSSSFEHVNVTSGFSSLSASSEMTIDDKRRFNRHNYVDEQCSRTPNNAVGESRQTVSSSPSLPVAHQSKVSYREKFFVANEGDGNCFLTCKIRSQKFLIDFSELEQLPITNLICYLKVFE